MNYIVLTLLFILPLIVLPVGISLFETPKIFISQILIEILFLRLIFTSRLEFAKFKKNFLIISILAILSLSVIHILIYGLGSGFFGNVFRLQGIYMLWHLLVWAMVVTCIKQTSFPLWVTLGSLVTLFLSTQILGTNEAGRVVGTLGEPNALAATAIFIWPFAYFKVKQIPIRIITLLISLSIVLISQSRSGMIAIISQILFLTISSKFGFRKALISVLLLCLVSFGFTFVDNNIYENRAEIWVTAIVAPLSNSGSFFQSLIKVLIGGGFGNTEIILNKASWFLSNNVRFQYVDSSHNIFLDWWVQGGILGLGLLIALIYRSGKNFLSYNRSPELIALIGIIMTFSFNPASAVGLIHFWWLIGRGFSQKNEY